MKKALKLVFSIVIMLAVAIPAMTSVKASSTDNKSEVYYYLTNEVGFNSAAASGIMANIEHESAFISDIVKRDSNGKLSGGLCMWNGARFSNLKNFCNNNGYNYLSIKGQMKYLKHELQQNYYKYIYNYLKSVPNNAQGAYDAAYYWCYHFEVPANRASKAASRASSAVKSYWPIYGKIESPKKVKLSSSSSGKTVDIDSSVKLNWTSGGSGTTNYVIYFSKASNGKHDWNKAKKITLSSKVNSYKLSLKGKTKGSYSVYVVARNKMTGKTSKKSNIISFKIDCIKHSYTSSVKRQPTETKSGIKLYVCKKCGYTYSKTIPKVTNENFTKSKVNLKVKSASTSKVTLSWSKVPGASGYEIYRLSGDNWKKTAVVSDDKFKYTVSGLKKAKVYTFRVRAVRKKGGKIYCTSYAKVNAATAPDSTKIVDVSRPCKGGAGLWWNKVNGADGYVIYTSESRNGKYKKLKVIKGGSKTSCTIKGLKSGRYYYFKVKAYKSGSNTAYSAASSEKFVITL